MISPADIAALNSRTDEDRRQIIAAAAGIHAARDKDGGALIATALHRVADRLNNKPRKAA